MKAGDYYIKVYQSYSYATPVDCKYNIKVNFVAGNNWEIEDNDNTTCATAISENVVYAGTLYKEKDVDLYKVNVTKQGYMQVTLSIGSGTNVDKLGYGWDLIIYDANYKEIKSYNDIDKNFTSAVLPFSKGSYYIKVYQSYYAPIDCTYNLKVTTVENNQWETECNDENTTADSISVNKLYKGTLYQNGDVDWYKVKTTKTGYFNVKFTVDSSNNLENIGDGWYISILNANAEEIVTYYTTYTFTTVNIPYAKGTYYVKIYAKSTSDAPVDCIYHVEVKETASKVWESEGNDTQNKADVISLNKKYHALTMQGDDTDWYKFTVKKSGSVKIDLKKHSSVNVEDIKNGWSVYVYKKSSSEPVKVMEGIKNKDSVTLNVKKGIYYIKVCASNYNSFLGTGAPFLCRYELKASFSEKPATVSIKSVKAGKKKATITWKKASKATGYYVYRSTSKNGKYTKIATIKKGKTVKYVDKKVKSGKKYYYKIIAINKSNGVTAKGSYSKIKNVKVK